MRLRKYIFRVLLPLIYLCIALLFFGAAVATIFEGPNPFDFLFYPAFYPASFLLEILPMSLWPVENVFIEALFVASINVLIYFVGGYLLDFGLNRKWERGRG